MKIFFKIYHIINHSKLSFCPGLIYKQQHYLINTYQNDYLRKKYIARYD